MIRTWHRPGDDGPGAARHSTTATTHDAVLSVPPSRAWRLTDTFAWGGVFLDDGRVVSIAWLRGYSGAVASPARCTP